MSLNSGNSQVQATIRSHLDRWKDGRHFQQATRVSTYVSAAQAGTDANVLRDAGDSERVQSSAGHRRSVGRRQRKDTEQPATQLPLLPLHTTVDVNSYENETRDY